MANRERGRKLEKPMSRALRCIALTAASLLLGACGSEGDESDTVEPATAGPEAEQLLAAEPDCPGADAPLLRIQGTIDGEPVDVEQRNGDASGGFTQLGDQSQFAVPMPTDQPDPGLLYVHLFWVGGIQFGHADEVAGGSVILPESHPAGGQGWCVYGGMVGMVAQQDEATRGSLKFSIRGLSSGEDCSGDSVPVELSGCWVSSH
jgi:hypothetical protein